MDQLPAPETLLTYNIHQDNVQLIILIRITIQNCQIPSQISQRGPRILTKFRFYEKNRLKLFKRTIRRSFGKLEMKNE